MYFQLKPMSRGLAVAFGGIAVASTLALPAQAQQAPAPAQKLERVEITGSNIRRTDTETVQPVQIITREEIEKSGKPTVAEVLRDIPANIGGSFSEAFANSFAPGASGISLRGLGQKTTLVLINGRRVAGFGFAQNLQDTFVDLNSIPTSAVERIEVLRDGASAIYGSDAIAGVVNVILRRKFVGAEVGALYGHFNGENEYRVNAAIGAGEGKFNAFGVIDFFKRGEIVLADTEHGKDRDYREFDGGRNAQSLTTGGTWRQLSATNGLLNNYKAISGCPADQVLTVPQAIDRGFILPTAAQASNPANTFCSGDINKYISALPETQRIGFLGRATYDASDTTQLYAELGLSHIETSQTFSPSFWSGTTGLTPTSAGLRPFAYNINFGPGISGNPFASNARLLGSLFEVPTRTNDITSDAYRILIGAKYSIGKWDLDSGVGYSRSEDGNENKNRLGLAAVSAMFGVPTTAQPPVPLSTRNVYNLDNPTANAQSLRDSLLVSFPRDATSELTFVDTKASTQFGSLPGGPIGLALGAEFRSEKLSDRPADIAKSGGILGQGITATTGSRDNYAAFAELALPVLKNVEAQAAVRYDHYSDFGSTTNPKLGLKFTPSKEFLIRANWGRGFRAPTLPEITPSVATFFTTVNDPVTGQNGINISGVFAGNPNLLPEKSRSANVGVVWEPTRNFNLGIDIYEISWTNIVRSPSFQSIVNAGDPAKVIRDPNNNNQIVTVLSNYENQAKTLTRGLDFDSEVRWSTAIGRFAARLNATYVDTFEENGVESAGNNGGTNTIPRWKGNVALEWARGPLTIIGKANYIHSYTQLLVGASFFAPSDPRFQNGVYPLSVPSYTSYDLVGRYDVTKKLRVTATVQNLTNRKPPYDPGFSATYLYDFSIYDIRGRQFRIAANYAF